MAKHRAISCLPVIALLTGVVSCGKTTSTSTERGVAIVDSSPGAPVGFTIDDPQLEVLDVQTSSATPVPDLGYEQLVLSDRDGGVVTVVSGSAAGVGSSSSEPLIQRSYGGAVVQFRQGETFVAASAFGEGAEATLRTLISGLNLAGSSDGALRQLLAGDVDGFKLIGRRASFYAMKPTTSTRVIFGSVTGGATSVVSYLWVGDSVPLEIAANLGSASAVTSDAPGLRYILTPGSDGEMASAATLVSGWLVTVWSGYSAEDALRAARTVSPLSSETANVNWDRWQEVLQRSDLVVSAPTSVALTLSAKAVDLRRTAGGVDVVCISLSTTTGCEPLRLLNTGVSFRTEAGWFVVAAIPTLGAAAKVQLEPLGEGDSTESAGYRWVVWNVPDAVSEATFSVEVNDLRQQQRLSRQSAPRLYSA